MEVHVAHKSAYTLRAKPVTIWRASCTSESDDEGIKRNNTIKHVHETRQSAYTDSDDTESVRIQR